MTISSSNSSNGSCIDWKIQHKSISRIFTIILQVGLDTFQGLPPILPFPDGSYHRYLLASQNETGNTHLCIIPKLFLLTEYSCWIPLPRFHPLLLNQIEIYIILETFLNPMGYFCMFIRTHVPSMCVVSQFLGYVPLHPHFKIARAKDTLSFSLFPSPSPLSHG